MKREINLLSSLPKVNRNVQARAKSKTPEVIRIAKQFGYDYFDGDRCYGYGGLKYDGRYQSVSDDIVKFFKLKEGDRVLDIGCGKGFLLYDLMTRHKLDVVGLDISKYAIKRCNHALKRKLYWGTAEKLPFPDKSFDLVLSINTLHNLPRNGVLKALREIERVSKGKSYIVVDAYKTEEERNLFLDWVLTAETHGYPEEWRKIFKQAGYKGHFSWNLM